MKRKVRSYCVLLVRVFGTRIKDYRTGEYLGKALIWVWGGTVHVIGYTGDKPLLVEWLPEERVRYWRCRIGFTTYQEEGVYE